MISPLSSLLPALLLLGLTLLTGTDAATYCHDNYGNTWFWCHDDEGCCAHYNYEYGQPVTYCCSDEVNLMYVNVGLTTVLIVAITVAVVLLAVLIKRRRAQRQKAAPLPEPATTTVTEA